AAPDACKLVNVTTDAARYPLSFQPHCIHLKCGCSISSYINDKNHHQGDASISVRGPTALQGNAPPPHLI
ncbi:MAG: hypothetical protein OXF50_17795, partial [Caldilineaceae bacterium]|nr:hypothetical protein [Caldilineaceae bacterium]